MNNLEIAELLRSVAAALKIKDKQKNFFRITAYERAADAVEHLSSEAKDLWDDDELESVGGIGESIAKHLGDIFKTGKSKHFEEIMSGIPPATFELIKVSGIGPKTAYKISNKFKTKFKKSKKPIDVLKSLAEDGEIADLEGFGEDSQETILKSAKEVEKRVTRHLLPYAQNIAGEIIKWLKKCDEVDEVEVLGSLRRKASTIGDIDIAVATQNPKKVMDHFELYPLCKRVIKKGEKSSSILITNDEQIDLKIVDPSQFGSLLQHFTGSKHHNIALREYAKSLSPSLSLSEYGIRKIKDQKSKSKTTNDNLKINKFKSEKSFYNFLGMAWIPPELREDNGEIDVALSRKVPNLVKIEDIKADLQIHSDFDIETSHDLGLSSMKEIVKKASNLGYQYIAFTEHNPSQSGHTDKDIVNLLSKKYERVIKLNEEISGDISVKKAFNSLEVDILPDGSLPISEKAMEFLDFALVSIHSSFKQSRSKMTKRILTALDNPKVKIFAHPTGRKLNKREGVEIDWEKVFDFCLKNNKWIEINADPTRLDLPDHLVREAVRLGVKLTLGTDAHHTDHMENMRWGVSVARRGWCERKDIVNTLGIEEFEKLL